MVKNEILEILDFMKIIYQGRKIDINDNVITTWEIMFADYSKTEIMNSIKKLALHSKYIPSIHEILDNIEEMFAVEKMVNKDVIVIFVIYLDEKIPFKFKSKESALELISFLKSGPSREDIRLLCEKNVREMNPFTKFTYVDQSQRDEFDQQKKNEYYALKSRQMQSEGS